MAMFELKTEAGRRELLVFAALWLIFWPLLGAIWLRAGEGLLVLAGVTALCAGAGAAARVGRGLVAWGFPAVLGGLGLAALVAGEPRLAEPAFRRAVMWLSGLVGLAGAVGALGSPRLGRGMYRAWMRAAFPIGWAISHVLLGAVFFGVVTPIGLVMRALGRDPLARRFERSRTSYWMPRRSPADVRRYFSQS